MIKFLLLSIFASLATTAHSDDVNTGESESRVALEIFRYDFHFIRDLLDAACVAKEFLSDPEVNANLYALRDSVPDTFAAAKTCVEPMIFAAANDKNSGIGKITTILRLGNSGEIKRWDDILAYLPFFPAVIPYLIYLEFGDRLGHLSNEIDRVSSNFFQNCESSFETVKNNFDFLEKRLNEISTKYYRVQE